ncbi:methylmalonyl-CoA epimerase [Aurantiacibacter gangjinensis]|uniref:Methylmalonyl-CoA epimerase n=1 Tax=Aurantiacibacter gangjinensis TaxID=502682 RepID=A0A0G9MV56_9SPHN|nr:methylmalonyl-CoA epimerase [Aurantiacibacter gangjinensis]APE29071.1 Methylmalonyl-CoA epimerase; Ethylmalonyl-CoA epimerase [Aurantiacibacter gangjinensis]KLE33163.1 methylmalonyl-CoA epimerase [Aurantiacibacter gangjinensis]
MKLGRLNHIGVVTPSIVESVAHYRETMGATATTEPFDLPAQGVKVCFVDTPDAHGEVGKGTQIELIEPLGEDSPIHKFLEKNPLGGQHHVCFEVEDIAEARSWFEGQGKRILGPTRTGAHGTPIFFLHPKDMMGQLTEIMETPRGDGH